ncbi:MAG: sulfite exporter TauE/SafE family protein [Clostridiales bacterium]|nr:sulfite exporter TauE/SafE family protein [Candidatus Equinaster intestinalis]
MFLNKKTLKYSAFGLLVGLLNGMLGSGGGMVAVPVLKKLGFEQKDAQANAIAVIWPISLVSTVLYIVGGKVSIGDALIFLPGGVAGALAGTFLLSKIPAKWLKRIFGGFMIWAGVRLLMR